jgi:hypothetical protein
MGKCEVDVASVPDTLMRFTICSIVSRLVFRQYEPVLLTATLQNQHGGGMSCPRTYTCLCSLLRQTLTHAFTATYTDRSQISTLHHHHHHN